MKKTIIRGRLINSYPLSLPSYYSYPSSSCFAMEHLPIEVIHSVVDLLDMKSILSLSSCCKKLNKIVFLECKSLCIYTDNNIKTNFHNYNNSYSLTISANNWYLFIRYVQRHTNCLLNTHTIVIINKESIFHSMISQNTPPSSSSTLSTTTTLSSSPITTTAFKALRKSIKSISTEYLPNLKDTLYIQ